MAHPVLETPHRDGRPLLGRTAAWFAILGGGIAWTLHLLLAYLVAEFGCLSGLDRSHFAGLTVVTWLLIGVSLLAFGLAVISIVVSVRIRHRLRDTTKAEGENLAVAEFTGRLGLISNVAFAGVILVQSVPICYFLREC